jgi:hypothetical protein
MHGLSLPNLCHRMKPSWKAYGNPVRGIVILSRRADAPVHAVCGRREGAGIIIIQLLWCARYERRGNPVGLPVHYGAYRGRGSWKSFEKRDKIARRRRTRQRTAYVIITIRTTTRASTRACIRTDVRTIIIIITISSVQDDFFSLLRSVKLKTPLHLKVYVPGMENRKILATVTGKKEKFHDF